MIIISAGKAFNDIDAFACALTYRELLQKEGRESLVVFPGPLNHSVTSLAKEQSADYFVDYSLNADDLIVYVDLSDAKHFAFGEGSVPQVVELYDHHYGFETEWTERLGTNSHIERLGAAATLIWEEFKKREFAETISPQTANLLSIAILQNTLNFTSTETNDRDRSAFAELASHRSMADGWEHRYVEECSEALEEYFDDSLRHDTKIIDHLVDEKQFVFSQLEITEDPKIFLENHQSAIVKYWSETSSAHHLINIADMSSKTSLLYSNDGAWLMATIIPLFSSTIDRGEGWILISIHQRKQVLKLIQNR